MLEEPITDCGGRRRPGRPRSAATHRAILEAAAALLAEEGYQGMSVEAVAERAGTSKATIYRWWPSKEALLVEALDRQREEVALPRTGDARRDLVGFLSALVSGLPPRDCSPIARLVGAMADSDELAATFRTHVIGPRRAGVAALLEAAVAQGRLAPDLDLQLAVDQLVAPILYRHLISGAPLGGDLAERLVDALFRAHQPRPTERPGAPGPQEAP